MWKEFSVVGIFCCRNVLYKRKYFEQKSDRKIIREKNHRKYEILKLKSTY